VSQLDQQVLGPRTTDQALRPRSSPSGAFGDTVVRRGLITRNGWVGRIFVSVCNLLTAVEE